MDTVQHPSTGSIRYFAYGSNMLSAWLRKRVPGTAVVGIGELTKHRLAFQKGSVDGSGKCNLVATEQQADVVYGVLYDLPTEQLPSLDRAEGAGHGYDRTSVVVRCSGSELVAHTYLADHASVDASLMPYDWYLQLVVAGAEEHALPARYLDRIKSTLCRSDPKVERKTRSDALKILSKVTRGSFRDGHR